MTFNELIRYFAIFGVKSDEITPLLGDIDLGSPEKMQAAKVELTALQTKARKGFRQLAMPLHPDRNSSPQAHQKYNEYARVISIIKGLTVGALHGLYDPALHAQDTPDHYGDAPAGMDDTFEDAQRDSFMAMAKHYKGPMTPLGWMGNKGPPSPTGDPSRTFVKQLPDVGGFVDVDPSDDGPPRRRR